MSKKKPQDLREGVTGDGDSNLRSTLLLEVLFITNASTCVLALVVKRTSSSYVLFTTSASARWRRDSSSLHLALSLMSSSLPLHQPPSHSAFFYGWLLCPPHLAAMVALALVILSSLSPWTFPSLSVVIARCHHDHLLIQLPLLFADCCFGLGHCCVLRLMALLLPHPSRCGCCQVIVIVPSLLVTHHCHHSLIILSPPFMMIVLLFHGRDCRCCQWCCRYHHSVS